MKRIERSPEADREKIFLALVKQRGLPRPHREYRFDASRRWRFDYAWPERGVALEVDGGLYVRGAHVRGARVERTHEKMNAAAAQGWRILYCAPRKLCTDEIMTRLHEALESAVPP